MPVIGAREPEALFRAQLHILLRCVCYAAHAASVALQPLIAADFVTETFAFAACEISSSPCDCGDTSFLFLLAQVLELLKVELEHSMALSGCCNLGAITKDLLIGPGGYGCQSKL